MASRIEYREVTVEKETGEKLDTEEEVVIFYCDRCKSTKVTPFDYFSPKDLFISYGSLAVCLISIIIGITTKESLIGLFMGVIGLGVYFAQNRRLVRKFTCNECGLTNLIGGPERPIHEILAEPRTKQTLGFRSVVAGLLFLLGIGTILRMQAPGLRSNLLIFAVFMGVVAIIYIFRQTRKK